MMAFHYFLLPYCYGSNSSRTDSGIGWWGNACSCVRTDAYVGWHVWAGSHITASRGSTQSSIPLPTGGNKVSPVVQGWTTMSSCKQKGKLWPHLRDDVHHSKNPVGKAVTNRSSKLPFLREGLPWDRTFWRTSPWLKHWFPASPLIVMPGTQSWGFPSIYDSCLRVLRLEKENKTCILLHF